MNFTTYQLADVSNVWFKIFRRLDCGVQKIPQRLVSVLRWPILRVMVDLVDRCDYIRGSATAKQPHVGVWEPRCAQDAAGWVGYVLELKPLIDLRQS